MPHHLFAWREVQFLFLQSPVGSGIWWVTEKTGQLAACTWADGEKALDAGFRTAWLWSWTSKHENSGRAWLKWSWNWPQEFTFTGMPIKVRYEWWKQDVKWCSFQRSLVIPQYNQHNCHVISNSPEVHAQENWQTRHVAQLVECLPTLGHAGFDP